MRVDTWVERGSCISPHYDSLLAKIMVFAPHRPAAIQQMGAALAQTQVGARPQPLPDSPGKKKERKKVRLKG